VDYRNRLLPRLDTVNKVQARAECYVTIQSQQANKPAQISLCSETRKSAGNTSNKQKKKVAVVATLTSQKRTKVMVAIRKKEAEKDCQLIIAAIRVVQLITLLVIVPMETNWTPMSSK
jgi:hypothetical protein